MHQFLAIGGPFSGLHHVCLLMKTVFIRGKKKCVFGFLGATLGELQWRILSILMQKLNRIISKILIRSFFVYKLLTLNFLGNTHSY